MNDRRAAISIIAGLTLAVAACGDPAGESNSRLTGANWVWLILGGFLWILVIIGTAMMIAEFPQ